jgi:predicted GIY-YIG superfamily endonuclease|tara:strand:+ start:439 stop:876 length:438 start_codon:yes stop_codon:yes gene_type:complete
MVVIYKIECGKDIYIGQTNDLHRRSLEHRNRAFSTKWDSKLYRAIRQQGYFELLKIDECESHLANKLEQFWIFKLKPTLNTNFAHGEDPVKERARRKRFYDQKRYCRFCDQNVASPNWWKHSRTKKHQQNCLNFCQEVLLSQLNI